MTIQQLQMELEDKLEYFNWLVKDIEDTVNKIDELKNGSMQNETF